MRLLGDTFLRSMLVVLIYGLSFATLLTVVRVPVNDAIVYRIRAGETGPMPKAASIKGEV